GTAVIWEQQQEPGLIYGVPQLGIKDEQGRWFENQEIIPDILVYNDPESVVQVVGRFVKQHDIWVCKQDLRQQHTQFPTRSHTAHQAVMLLKR
ncbi:hypothetical protein, partial [Vibrio cholerae]|uniref:hypothetical protein n=1 Tax=Vibrio cholerae TaxID=666 RepID=UPI001483BBE1